MRRKRWPYRDDGIFDHVYSTGVSIGYSITRQSSERTKGRVWDARDEDNVPLYAGWELVLFAGAELVAFLGAIAEFVGV